MGAGDWSAVVAAIEDELRKRFPGTMPTRNEIKAAIADICKPAAHPDITVDIEGRAVHVTGLIQFAEQIEALLTTPPTECDKAPQPD